MFNLHHLEVELWVLIVLESVSHFAFLGVFTDQHLITGLQGTLSDPLLFPVGGALFLRTMCLLEVAKNLRDH